jgi:xanthine dehydrogenase YagR molybdenum-binding subunit
MKKQEDELYYVSDIPVPETPDAGESPEPWGETRIVGKPVSRVDGYERVSGSAVYPSDVVLPGMLYGAMVRCPYPNARVRRVDARKAVEMPGVHAVITAEEMGPGLKWPYSKEMSEPFFPEHCRYEGEAVAAVAAESPYLAREAARAVLVEYEVLPFVVDETRALEPGAPEVHSSGNQVKKETYERGDVNKGFEEADAVLEETYTTPCELHTPLELHGCVATWERDRLTIHESTQGVYAVQSRVAQVLGLPLSKVRVIGDYLGGGFGSKLQAGKYTVAAALLARRTGRPVKFFLSREETYLAVGNRPANHMKLKAGVRKDGTLTALDFSVLGSGGAYPAGGTALVDWLVRDLYTCPNVRTEATDVYIHAGPARPFRAPGHPQGAWALEQMLDALAEKIGMDPVALRLKNVPERSQAREGNPPYTSRGLEACLKEGAEAFEWEKRKKEIESRPRNGHLRRGVGMASSLWFVGGGGPPSTVVLKLFSDGSVNLNMGASDIGTGTKTVMALVAAEELGVRPEVIQIEHADTGTTQYATPSGGSKTVPTEAPTVRDAALQVKRKLLEMAAEDLGVDPDALRVHGQGRISTRDGSKEIRVTDVKGLSDAGVIIGVGHRGPNPEDMVVNPFAAQFCEVEVNLKSGEVRLIRFLGAHESGRVMSRLTYDNQVYGGIVMGVGFAMTEFRILDRKETGKMVNKNWHDYKLPTALDTPLETVSSPVERPDEEANTTGAKGLGEPVTIPTAAAIANAVYHATGVRVTDTPVNPARLSELLNRGRKEA